MISIFVKEFPNFKREFTRANDGYNKEIEEIKKQLQFTLTEEQLRQLEVLISLKVFFEVILVPLFGVSDFYETLNKSKQTNSTKPNSGEEINILAKKYIFNIDEYKKIKNIENSFYQLLKELQVSPNLLTATVENILLAL